MRTHIVMDVVVFKYTDRPIFDVLLDNAFGGGAAAYDGGRAIATGVSIPLGPQTLTWRDAGTGNTVEMKNTLNLTDKDVSDNAQYLAIHIYPDDTVEVTFDEYLPTATKRGKFIMENAEKNGQ
ncbi:hypothetical protein [Paraburkholderia kirstenboschensis]|uniref:Uncharacterized protein n=1 Tax=Paraburkholderia kirstenboschensis TaxID=1245436 RepID=A0ABZ0EVL0_9BURK|nr:hypothetical protein [Paraburkholderia kirstenboschensis]WOD20736.1 hypothetical protein RW095_31745 [Paraburkholderia kirstenboschensis]